MRLLVALMVVLALFVAAPAAGQNVVNPGTLVFTVSPDHAQLTSYKLGFFRPAAAEPFQTLDIGLPTPDANGTAIVNVNTRPLPFGIDYTVKLQSVAGTATSEWSEPSNPFDRRPGPPSKPVVVVTK